MICQPSRQPDGGQHRQAQRPAFAENVCGQYVAGYEYFDATAPCDTPQIGRVPAALEKRAWRSCSSPRWAAPAPAWHRDVAGARRPCAFGVKVSVATTHKQMPMVGARSFRGNPWNGHTRAGQIGQSTILPKDITPSRPGRRCIANASPWMRFYKPHDDQFFGASSSGIRATGSPADRLRSNARRHFCDSQR